MKYCAAFGGYNTEQTTALYYRQVRKTDIEPKWMYSPKQRWMLWYCTKQNNLFYIGRSWNAWGHDVYLENIRVSSSELDRRRKFSPSRGGKWHVQSPCVHVEHDLIEKQETCMTRAHEVREKMVRHSAREGGRGKTRSGSVGHIEHL